jgi:DNA modification methylase
LNPRQKKAKGTARSGRKESATKGDVQQPEETTQAASEERTHEQPTEKPIAQQVKVAKVKGRPMLSWVGKRPLTQLTAFPAQHIETFAAGKSVSTEGVWKEWPAGYPRGGLLFHGDNKEVLTHLLANGFRGKVKLVYIDPPFDSGADYVRKVSLRGISGSAKLDGESYSLGEQIQYTDIWANDNYLQFMYERLLLLRELLSDKGAIWLHCDVRRSHLLRGLMDEVFGIDQFVNEVVWRRSDAHSDVGQGARHLGSVHDTLLLYRKSENGAWNDLYLPLPETTKNRWYRHVEEGTGRRYNKADITGPGGMIKGNPVYEWKGIRRAWRYSLERMKDLDARGLLVYSESGMPYLKRYLDESKGVPLQDWWGDIAMIRGIHRDSGQKYPTEKPEPLVERILRISSDPGDLVLDCFIGSGTTAAVAQKLGRRWIGCDINKGAIQLTSKRLQSIMLEQEAAQQEGTQSDLLDDTEPQAAPAQLSFTNWRVNDYDLQIQHNEAVELACHHIGVERTRSDSFFDGVLGKKLVKIVPFSHPLTPLDLEAVRRELEARPEEDRDVVMICLGQELAADAWLEDWNRMRRAGGAPNRIEAIELRTDPKYGKFFAHRPAEARVEMRRRDDRIEITIADFISPTILERLELDLPLFRAKITDWRSQVDCVLIDTAYNGAAFKVVLADIPERKDELVSGRYDLAAPVGRTTIAVKIIDMLGEEVVVRDEL